MVHLSGVMAALETHGGYSAADIRKITKTLSEKMFVKLCKKV